MGLGTAEGGGEWPVGGGADDLVGLVGGEAAGADELGPAGPLGGGGDGVVLRSELGDAAPPGPLVLPHLVG